MHMKKQTWGFVLLSLMLVGCSAKTPVTTAKQEPVIEESTYDASMADSIDEAVLIDVNEAKKELYLQNVETGKTYRLSYTGATTIQDKNGTELVIGQIQEGALLTVTFLHEKKEAKGIYLHKEADVYQNVTPFTINKAGHKITFHGETYTMHETMPVISEGKKIELMEISDQDVLTVSAIGHTVYSIDIAKGHGYLRLENAEAFEDGWIELGQSFIRPVTKGMLLTVPEGTYTMLLSKGDVQGTKEVTIARGEEVSVDATTVAKVTSTEPAKTGRLIFTITPESATLYIDGEQVDYSDPISLTYGLHKITCRADGYATITKYFRVSEESATINVVMERPKTDVSGNKADTNKPVSDNSVSQNNVIKPATDGYVVNIDAPVGAELYVDDNYVGLIPTSFPKKQGEHTISVRKSGYQTRSYTLSIDGQSKDVSYSFSDLIKSD